MSSSRFMRLALSALVTGARSKPFTKPFLSISGGLLQVNKLKVSLRFHSTASAMTLDSQSVKKQPFERLPTTVKPVNYRLRLHPDLTKFSFTGTSDIDVTVSEATNKVIINAAELKIDAVSFKTAGGKSLTGSVSLEPEEERAIFSFPEPIPVGNGVLSLKFDGTLNEKLKGFYRSKYRAPNGEERYAAVTQFEPTDARRAFPCWDEPAIKASFDVTLVAPKDKVALSNMPVKNEKVEGELKVVEYERTPIMSTYLVAFVIGDFDHIEMKDANGVLVRVFTQVGKKEQGRFALEVSAKALPFYKEYFNVGYPLPKMDLVAIPDFAAGAMENWGLTTYRETALLVDPEQTAIRNKQYVALVVCHELAHQWFGNLVTMEWWTHLWLNEGYATWIEYLCVEKLFPDWKIWSQFLSLDYSRAMGLDALKNSHAIEVPVGHPSEIDEIFDAISYSKGASVIRMIHDFIGDAAFKKGMETYLNRHKYGNAETGDLWKALSEASGKDIGRIMNYFTGQVGYPVLYVDQKATGGISLRQEKFNADGSRANGPEAPIWPLPVTAVRQHGKIGERYAEFLFDKRDGEALTRAETLKPEEWIKFNAGTVGFYRVRYSAELLEKLSRGVKDGTLSPADRLGLTADLFALCRAGFDVSIPQLLEFFTNFPNETDYAVWEDIAGSHSAIATLIQYTPHGDSFKAYSRKLFGPVARRVGWDGKPTDNPNQALLRALALSKMGLAGDAHTIAEARRRFDDHVAKKVVLPADLRATVYGIVAKFGGEDTYNQMYQMYKETDLNEEKVRLLRGLGQHDDVELKRRFLAWSLTDEVKVCDVHHAVNAFPNSADGSIILWEFTKKNWEVMRQRYDGTLFLFSRMFVSMTETLFEEGYANDIETFYAANPVHSIKRVAKQCTERVRVNAAWLVRERALLDKYFS